MRHQKGASYIAILLAVIGFAFMAKIAIAVWGPYVDDRLINNQIEEQLQNGPKKTLVLLNLFLKWISALI